MKIHAGKDKVTVIPANSKRTSPQRPTRQKLRVAAYCRVSSEKDEQLNSFAVQVSYYTEKITNNPEWKMAGIYADEGITGTSMKHRDDFKRMLRACREGRIDLILCKSVSRFGRNSVDVLRTIRSLRERNIGVIFEKEGVDTRTMNSELILAFLSAFSQSESESIRENIIRGLQMAYAQGTVTLRSDVFGFRKGNAFKHALDLYKPLHLDILCGFWREEGFSGCRLTVEDNGVGFPQEVLEEYQKELPEDRLPPKGHLGLSNIRHTLQFTYHRQDLLRLSNKEDGGARAEILIPIEEEQA